MTCAQEFGELLCCGQKVPGSTLEGSVVEVGVRLFHVWPFSLAGVYPNPSTCYMWDAELQHTLREGFATSDRETTTQPCEAASGYFSLRCLNFRHVPRCTLDG
jgi:hypothetical protein